MENYHAWASGNYNGIAPMQKHIRVYKVGRGAVLGHSYSRRDYGRIFLINAGTQHRLSKTGREIYYIEFIGHPSRFSGISF